MVNDEEVFCFKCKKKVAFQSPKIEEKKTKRGVKYMATSICPVCSTKVCKLVKKPGK